MRGRTLLARILVGVPLGAAAAVFLVMKVRDDQTQLANSCYCLIPGSNGYRVSELVHVHPGDRRLWSDAEIQTRLRLSFARCLRDPAEGREARCLCARDDARAQEDLAAFQALRRTLRFEPVDGCRPRVG